MARPCSICTHAQCPDIDAALVDGQLSNRAVSRQFRVGKAGLTTWGGLGW